MRKDRLSQGVEARIILETIIHQEEQVFKNSFDEIGRLVLMNGNYYLRFEETNGKTTVPTLIKISPEGNVNITRHTDNKTRLEFNEEEHTYTNYYTPAGLMKLRVKTNRIDLSYQDTPFAGDIEIDYAIYTGDSTLGSYQIRLRFTT